MSKIKKLTKEPGTNQPVFEPAIRSAAGILANRDAVYVQYVEEGSRYIVKGQWKWVRCLTRPQRTPA